MDHYEPPFYLFRSSAECWSCGKTVPVMVIAGVCLEDVERSEDPREDLACLEYIRSLPPELDEMIEQLYPGYRPTYSNTVRDFYFANVCPHCDSLFGDHFIYRAFMFAGGDLVEQSKITYELLPLQSEYDIDAEPSWGMAKAVFEYGSDKSTPEIQDG